MKEVTQISTIELKRGLEDGSLEALYAKFKASPDVLDKWTPREQALSLLYFDLTRGESLGPILEENSRVRVFSDAGGKFSFVWDEKVVSHPKAQVKPARVAEHRQKTTKSKEPKKPSRKAFLQSPEGKKEAYDAALKQVRTREVKTRKQPEVIRKPTLSGTKQ